MIRNCPGTRTSVFGIAPDFLRTNQTKPMPKPTDQSVSLRRKEIIASWREFAPVATFANLTLAEFEVESKKPLDQQDRMRSLKTQLKGAKRDRDLSIETANDLFVAVANSIRGDTNYGPNSSIYRSLGYVPKAERKRPARKAKNGTTAPEADPPAETDAA